MKTIPMTTEDMAERVARFEELTPMAAQNNERIPLEAADLIWSRKLMPVITYGEGVEGPFGKIAPITGAAGMTMTIATCPPGTGPGLHSHHKTFETFTVLQGRFEFFWGDEGQDSVVLDRFDTISVPPGVCRAFVNVSEEEGILQVVITGGVHDVNDIAFPPKIAEQIKSIHPPALEEFKKIGLTFNAGVG